MGPTGVLVLTTAILALAEDVPEESAGGRLHGIVTTTTGATFHGYLRWDEGQGGAGGWSWADLLAGSKELPPGNRRDAERLGMLPGRGSLEFRGVRIAWEGDGEEGPDSTWSGIRFGHLRRLTVAGERTVLLELTSGRTVALTLSASRPGSPRGVEVTPPRGEPVRVPWGDLAGIEFTSPPTDPVPAGGSLLYGTLTDQGGNTFTGYVSWGGEGVVTADTLLGGRAARGSGVPFSEIALIERVGAREVRVTLRGGEVLVLDRRPGRVRVSDPALGRLTLYWDSIDQVRFHAPDAPPSHADLDGGHRLSGTLTTRDGRTLSGLVRWENDQEWSTDILRVPSRVGLYEVELGQVERITRRTTRSAEVTLRDGRVLVLDGIDPGNRGTFVTADDGSVVAVDWFAFESLVFAGGR